MQFRIVRRNWFIREFSFKTRTPGKRRSGKMNSATVIAQAVMDQAVMDQTAMAQDDSIPGVSSDHRRINWITNLPFLAMHAACLGAFWVGISWNAVVLCAALYAIRMFGITAGYHRYFSHRSYRTSRAFQFVLAWIGCS